MTAAANETRLVPDELGDDLASAALALARGFHRGATMWVLAPQWEAHAHHIAVEFVHPVIVGKKALPAVALVGDDPVAQARVAARAGDVAVLVASADNPIARDLTIRAPAWGVETIWVGFGPRPPAGRAGHVLWVDDDDPMVAATGRFVLLYHLLWELTHVCFEHPGLLERTVESSGPACVTCGDEGRLAEVVRGPDAPAAPATVRTASGEEEVDVALVGDVLAGDLLLVHAGSALTRIEETT